MEIKEEYIYRFNCALYNLMNGMKKDMKQCCAMSGNLSEKEFMLIYTVGQKQNMKMSEIADNL